MLPRCLFLFSIALVSCSSFRSSVPGRGSSLFGDPKTLPESIDLVKTKHYSEAIPELRSLQHSDPRLDDYVLYYLGVAEARSGDSDALGHFGELRTQFGQSVWASAAALEMGKIYRQRGKKQEAESYLAIAAAAPDKETAASAHVEQAQLLIADGRNAEAAQVLNDVRQQARGTSAVSQARSLLHSLRAQDFSLAPQGTVEWLAEARLRLDERDYVGAEKAARAADPTGDNTEVRLVLAEALKGQGNTAAAISELGTIVDRSPDDPLASKALFRMAQLLWNEDEDIEAEAAFLQFLKRYHGHPSTVDALYALGRIQQSDGRNSAAVESYERLLQQGPDPKMAWEARWRIDWIRYGERRYGEASGLFAQLASSGGDSSEIAGARYWQARAAERAGRTSEANAAYQRIVDEQPITYYAGLAEERLGEEKTDAALHVDPPELPLPEAPATVNRFHLERFQALRDLGLSHLARGEVAAMERETSDSTTQEFLVYAYASTDDYAAARRLARDTQQLPAGVRERIQYPLAFWPEVSQAASTNEVDPLLVASIIRQESLFDPEARSPADARGLMQLLPITAHKEAVELGWKDDPTANLNDPAVNVTLGVRHFRSLLDEYDGDVVKALAAYNGGSRAVNKWQKQFAELEEDEFVESITYRETRDYVKRVLGNRRAYARLYATTG